MKKVFFSFLLIVMMTTMVFAGGKAEGQTVVGQKDMPEETYAMVVFLKGSEFFNWAYAGMVDAARAIGPHVKVELQGPAEWDATLEARAIDSLVARRVDGVVVTAGDAATLVPSINRAMNAGIPVITFDSDAPESERLAFVGTNNYNAGFEAGKAMAEWLKTGHIAISTFPGPDHLKNRVDGFTAAVKQYGNNIKISTVNDEGDVVKSETQLTALLQANSDINGIFGAHGNPGPGAASAVRSLGREGEVDIMAFDFGMPVIELMETGEIRGTVGQNPYLMGYMSMILAYSANHPTEVPSTREGFGHVPSGIDTGVAILDKDSVQMYKNPPKF
ncbi:MAG TPA: sugar ABC transporter substrate-binding protein [Sphaerochaeta sp.]|nr:sugar ABC transporter substrate-binding protein [Sphaerochaeta sp.]